MTKASVPVLTLLMAAAGLAAAELENPSWIDEVGDRVPTHTVVPIYPEKARRDRIEGEVQVCYDVDRKGRPYRVAVRSSSNRMFERPALRAIRASLYKPLADDEQTSGIKTCRTFRFQLQPYIGDRQGEKYSLILTAWRTNRCHRGPHGIEQDNPL